jgi:integrase
MKPRLKGKQYEISYRCPGYDRPFFERFATIQEANLRIAQIELDKSRGEFCPPKELLLKTGETRKAPVTVRQLMEEYVQFYGLNHWGDNYLSDNIHRIEHYINPYLGDVPLKELTARDLDIFYDSLQRKPAVILKGHKRTDQTITPSVIQRIHVLLRSALNMAVRWDYIRVNPAANVTPPEYHQKEQLVWTSSEALYALECCKDPILKTAMLLALGCSMRVGEILGLQWDHVFCDDEDISNRTARVYIDKELKRCKTESLQALEGRGRGKVIFKFPECKTAKCTTSLVLKLPKTESSVRTVYMAKTVALALQAERKRQNEIKNLMEEAYEDYNLVLAHDDGRPYEERQIMDLLRALEKENDLPLVVFHSLRHCSTTVKLQLSGGDIKAVQGDTGHAQARMVTDLYAHIDHEDRRQLAQKLEDQFFRRNIHPESRTGNDVSEAYELLQKNPEMAKLIVGILNAKTG